jgi:hypothetical protein
MSTYTSTYSETLSSLKSLATKAGMVSTECVTLADKLEAKKLEKDLLVAWDLLRLNHFTAHRIL